MKSIIFVTFLLLSNISFGGSETRNPGDIFETRFRLAQSMVLEFMNNYSPSPSQIDTAEGKIYLQHRLAWIQAVKNFELSSSLKRLFEDDGTERAAYAYPRENRIELNLPYLRQVHVSVQELFVLLVHETGHLIGIKDHDLLDRVGYFLLRQIPDKKNLKNSEGETEIMMMLMGANLRYLLSHMELALQYPETSAGMSQLRLCTVLGSINPMVLNFLSWSTSLQYSKGWESKLTNIKLMTLKIAELGPYCEISGKIAFIEAENPARSLPEFHQKLKEALANLTEVMDFLKSRGR